MSSIQDQIQKFDDLIRFVETELPIFAQQVLAADLIALVTNRVVQKGLNYKGTKFKPYSTKTVAAFRFWGLSRTQSAEKKVRALSRAGGALSYKNFRELNNLNADKKNFNFTGEMWRKFGIIRVQTLAGGVKIQMGGTTKAAEEKIEENSEREGVNIIEASEQERKIVESTTQGWFDRNAERILNS